MDIRKANPVRHFVYWVTGAEALAQAALSAESVRALHHDASLFLYTDEEERQPWADYQLQTDLRTHPLMVANLAQQVSYALSGHFTVPTAFLDADILLVRHLSIDGDADLAVTRRDFATVNKAGEPVVGVARSMPYNYGVILANPTVAATEALIWLRDRVGRLGPEYQAWYGNQLALRELVGFEPDRRPPYRTTRLLPWAKVRIEVLDGEEWNYTPQTLDEDLAHRRVLHLKGDRKHLMAPYLERLLDIKDIA